MQRCSATHCALSLSVIAALLALAAAQGALADAGPSKLEADCKDSSCGIEAEEDPSSLLQKTFAFAGSKSADLLSSRQIARTIRAASRRRSNWVKVCHVCAEWCEDVAQASDQHCFDPSIADPETLENECAPALKEKCDDDEECILDIMCKEKITCHEWKVEHCQHLELEQSASNHGEATALEQRAKARAHMPSLSTDNSVRGKCAEQ